MRSSNRGDHVLVAELPRRPALLTGLVDAVLATPDKTRS